MNTVFRFDFWDACPSPAQWASGLLALGCALIFFRVGGVQAQTQGTHPTAATPPAHAAAALERGVIVFNSNRTGNDEIYVMNAGGSGVRFVTNDDNVNGYPAWSKDGKVMYFHRVVYGGSHNFGIYAIRPDGTGMKMLAGGEEGNDEYPST